MIEVDRSANPATSGNVYVCGRSSPRAARTTACTSLARPTAAARSRTGEDLGQRARRPVARHRRRQHGPGVGRLAPVRIQGRQGPAAAQRGRVGVSTDGGRSFTKRRSRPSSPTGTWATRPAIPAAIGKAGYEACSSATPPSAAARARTQRWTCVMWRRAVRVSVRLRLRPGRFERPHPADPTPGADPDRPTRSSSNRARDLDADRDKLLNRPPTAWAAKRGRTSSGRRTAAASGRRPGSTRSRRGISSTATPTRTGEAPRRLPRHRSDTSTGPPGTVGDFRTVPFSTSWVGGAVGATHTSQGVETCYSRSTDGGAKSTHREVWEQLPAQPRAVRQPRHPVLRRLRLHVRLRPRTCS